jgi:hypothetical protein
MGWGRMKKQGGGQRGEKNEHHLADNHNQKSCMHECKKACSHLGDDRQVLLCPIILRGCGAVLEQHIVRLRIKEGEREEAHICSENVCVCVCVCERERACAWESARQAATFACKPGFLAPSIPSTSNMLPRPLTFRSPWMIFFECM